MRVLRLELQRFGPFTDEVLDFGPKGEGIQLIYGPNEAGKSSALRGLLGFLFGIPVQTGDAHLHDMRELQIGVVLRDEAGNDFRAVRVKGRKDTLRDETGAPIDEATLRRLLAGVDEQVFMTMFALDHDRLRQGGQELLRGGGDLAESLFGAGLGRGVHDVLSRLDQSAEDIYSPRAYKRKLNQAIREFQDAKRDAKQMALRPAQWQEADRELETAKQDAAKCGERLRELRTRQERLFRFQKLLPLLAKHREAASEREGLGEVRLLEPNAGRRREDAQREIAEGRRREEKLNGDIARLSAEQKSVVVPEALLTKGEAVEEIGEQLGAHKKAMKDVRMLEGQVRSHQTAAEDAMRELGRAPDLGSAEGLLVDTARQARLRTLVTKRASLMDRVRSTSESRAAAQSKLAAAEVALGRASEARDPRALLDALERVTSRGDLGAQLATGQRALDESERQAGNALAGLGLWRGEFDEVPRLPLPPDEVIDRLAAQWRQIEDDEKTHDAARERLDADMDRCDADIERMRSEGAVSTPDELDRVRDRRDRGWRLVRRTWLHGEDVSAAAKEFDPDRSLQEAYERSVAETDQVSDRLRSEADRAGRYAALLTRRDQVNLERDRLRKKEQEIDGRKSAFDREWQALWEPAGIKPLDPAAMRAWLGRHERLVSLVEALKGAERTQQDVKQRMGTCVADLTKALLDVGVGAAEREQTDLRILVTRAGAVARQMQKTVQDREQLEREIKKRQEELSDLTVKEEGQLRDLEACSRDWSGAIAGLGIKEDADVEEAEAYLMAVTALGKALSLKRLDESRIRGIQKDAAELDARVRALAEECAPDLAGRAFDEAAAALLAKYGKGRENQVKRTEIQRRIDAMAKEVLEAQEQAARAAADLDGLMAAAGCSDAQQLASAVQASDRARDLDRRILGLREQIDSLAAGATLEEICEQASGVAADALPAEIADASREIEAEETRERDLRERIGSKRKELEQMESAVGAGQAAAKAQEDLAKIRDLAEQYARLRLAVHVLQREIDRYRDEHQGPLLDRAGDVIRGITLGSFVRLKPDVDDKGKPLLLCVRAGGKEVPPEGLSDGTADQLFLALRLAALEQHFSRSEPLPFVLDDIFINFDDDRARAGLEALEELSKRTQVLFFTHHKRLCELAAETLRIGNFREHQLGNRR